MKKIKTFATTSYPLQVLKLNKLTWSQIGLDMNFRYSNLRPEEISFSISPTECEITQYKIIQHYLLCVSLHCPKMLFYA